MPEVTNPHCKARRLLDQMCCQCGLIWDVTDPDPPECRSLVVAPAPATGKACIEQLRETLNKGKG
jgi:hypothetical protein